MKKLVLGAMILTWLTAAPIPAAAELALSNALDTAAAGTYLPYSFTASGTGNTGTLPRASTLLAGIRTPWAVEWIEGDTAPSYPLSVAISSGSWSLTWTITGVDRFQYYFEAAGDNASAPPVNGDVTVTVTASGQSSGGLGSGEGTLVLYFW